MSDGLPADALIPERISGLVVVPAYNEEGNLRLVIDRLTGAIPRDHLLFVEDGSADRTAAILQEAGVPYLRHPVNLGYKEAMLTAMRYALAADYEYVVFFDADGQHRLVDLLAIITTYEDGEADFIIGTRFRKQPSSPWTLRRIGNRLFSLVTTWCSGVEITDVTCGLRLIARPYLQPILDLPSEDLHAELIVGLAVYGARIKEVDIVVAPREVGVSMYHFWKTIFYPAKTFLCLLGGIPRYARARRQRAEPAA